MTARNPTSKPVVSSDLVLAGKEVLASPLASALDLQEYIFAKERCDFVATYKMYIGGVPGAYTEIFNADYMGHDRCDSDTITASAIACEVYVLGFIETGFGHTWNIRITSSLGNTVHATGGDVNHDSVNGSWYGPISRDFASGGDNLKVEIQYTGAAGSFGGHFAGVSLFSVVHSY